MKKYAYATLAFAGVLSLSLLSSCKPKESINLDDYDIRYDNVNVDVATSGYYESFVEDNEARKQILAKLEDYAISNSLTGITLYDNGGYVKYNDRVKIPTKVVSKPVAGGHEYNGETFANEIHENVLGYGFGILSEGELTKPANVDDKYKTYLRSFEGENPNKLNYMDDKGSVVGNYYPYITSGLFDNRLATTGDKAGVGYEMFQSLATDANVVEGQARPLPVKDGALVANPQSDELYSRYRVYVRTDEVKYNVKEGTKFAKYDNTSVKLEDYLTVVKELHTQSNGLERAADDIYNAQSIKGMADYYEASKNGSDTTEAKAAWDKVQYKTGKDSTGGYVEFEFNTPCTPYFAQYYTGGGFFGPLPQQFVKEIGGIKNYAANGKTASGEKVTIVDTALSTGAFIVEDWNDQEFVFKNVKDEQSKKVLGIDDEHERFKIDGVHVKIDASTTKDPLAAWKEFGKGHYDSVAIPKDELKANRLTKGTQITRGDSTTKLNLNTCTQSIWNDLFGEQGSIMQTQKSDYYQCKPIMSDENFLKGLSFAIDRKTFAANHGVTPSVEYFSDAYMSNPEEQISYNHTQEHIDVMKKHYGENYKDNFGYNQNSAVKYFKEAAANLIASGAYNKGDKIEITITWMFQPQEKSHGLEIKKNIEDAWKLANTGLDLEIVNTSVASWDDVYYKVMMAGQFDIAFGGISGNPMNPLNFMEVLKSDNSSGFTLNWGKDTNEPAIAFNGKTYSYDGLFTAADTGAILNSNGSLANTYGAKMMENVHNEDGSRTLKFKVGASNISGLIKTKLNQVVLTWNDDPNASDTVAPQTIVFEGDDLKLENGVLTLTVSAEKAREFYDGVNIDFVFNQENLKNGQSGAKYVSISTLFPPQH